MHVIGVLAWLWLAPAGASAACTNMVSGYAYTWTVRTSTIAACPVAGTVAVTPAARVGDPVAATLTITNAAGVALAVSPPAFTGGSGAVWAAHPHPAAGAEVAPGATVVFTWTGTAVAAAPLTVSVRAAGARDGWPVSITAAGSGRVESRVRLDVAVIPPVTAPRSGDPFELRAVVTGSGDADITDLAAVLHLPDDAVAEIIRGPQPVPGPVAPGERVELMWIVRAGRAGGFPVRVDATARDGADAPSASGETTITVASRFDARCVVFPTPVAGDRLVVGLELAAPVLRVDVEAFNAALDRVYRGVWTGVRPGDELAIDGVSRWGAGAYVLRARALGPDGGWSDFPAVRFEVAR